MIFRAVCYDIGNQLFSIQDIEHSILRAKMSRPIMMNNSFFAQVLTPRFNKNDPRNQWALTKPDLRINFVVSAFLYRLFILKVLAVKFRHQIEYLQCLAVLARA